MKNKDFIILLVLLSLSLLLFAISAFIYQLNRKEPALYQDTQKELSELQLKLKRKNRLSPSLDKIQKELKNFAVNKQDSIAFVDSLEKRLQQISANTKIVSVQSKAKSKNGPAYIIIAINSTDKMKKISEILYFLENLALVSYVQSVSIDLDKDNLWQADIKFKVFSY